MKHYFFLFAFLTLCTSCSNAHLSCRSEYFSRKNLASTIIDTPDPRKSSDEFGQRLVIRWKVTEKKFSEGHLVLVLTVRLKNGEEKKSKITLKTRTGHTFYSIFGNDFAKKGGLQSYKAVLMSNGKALATSRHKLWVEKIKTS